MSLGEQGQQGHAERPEPRQQARPRTWRRYSDLLNSRDVDAVIIASPDFSHTPILIEAARLRLRPILMTSLAFVFGVVPLAWATGAGAELRQALGTAVFAGMIGVTAFGLMFTPAFYVICRWLAALGRRARPVAPALATPAA